MNLEVQTLDSLRKIIRELQAENKTLKGLLDEAKVPYASSRVFEDPPAGSNEFDPDQGARIIRQYVDRDLANRFFFMFWGREDVFAKRAKNGNYYPQCDNRWDGALCPKQRGEKRRCEECENTKWTKLTLEILINHLLGYREDGTDVVGVYPMFPGGTCRFLVFDFDNHEKDAEKTDFANENDDWYDEVDALRMICRKNGIDALVERSRSGRGAHVWIFFKQPIPAAVARNFGFLLLDKGAATVNLKSFRYYDRMYPSQDMANSIGNLVALPLQGQALRDGNSAFVDENWNAYPDQWKRLFETRKLPTKEVEQSIQKWQNELSVGHQETDYLKNKDRVKPWKRNMDFLASDVDGKLHLVLGDGVYVDALNLKPQIQHQIRCMAAFDNPVFYKNTRLGYSNYYNFSMIYMGMDVEGYIKIPRGLLEAVTERCEQSGISYDITDHREKGRPIRVTFRGDLRAQQALAAQQLLRFDNGILSAATAFGKTVVCSYLIAKRKVNTLILLGSKELLGQWEEELNRFLAIDEELPEYKAKSGRTKRRESVIGTLNSGRDTMTGIVDIAMIGSLYKRGAFHERLNSYGMVIMDECHHGASATAQEILKRVNAKYVYGVSATPVRSDGLEKINEMLLGPIRHKYTSLERAKEQGIAHLVYPRYTRVVPDVAMSRKRQEPVFERGTGQNEGESGKKRGGYRRSAENREDINRAFKLISTSEVRNEQIIDDIKECVKAEEERGEHFAVMDRKLVWHGGMNLLGKEDVWDNLIRVYDGKAAAELLELVFGTLIIKQDQRGSQLFISGSSGRISKYHETGG